MNLRQLQILIKVVELKSFTLAARELYLTQPAVTYQIRLLEEEYGADILDRSSKEIIPTTKGELLLNYAKQILDLYYQSKFELDKLDDLVRGNLIIGASTGPGEHILPKILGDFKVRYPHINIRLHIAQTEEIIRQIEERVFEIGIIGASIKESTLVFEPFIKDEIIVICGPKHSLAEKETMAFESLLKEPFIIQQRGAGIRTMFENGLAKLGLKLNDMNIFMELGLQESIKSAVAENFGLAIISRYAVYHELATGLLRELKIPDLPEFRNKFYLVRNPSRKLSRATEEFLSFAREYIHNQTLKIKDRKSVV